MGWFKVYRRLELRARHVRRTFSTGCLLVLMSAGLAACAGSSGDASCALPRPTLLTEPGGSVITGDNIVVVRGERYALSVNLSVSCNDTGRGVDSAPARTWKNVRISLVSGNRTFPLTSVNSDPNGKVMATLRVPPSAPRGDAILSTRGADDRSVVVR